MSELHDLVPEIALPDDRPIVATIGNFDGVHLGHRALIEVAKTLEVAEARDGGENFGGGENFVIALSFHPHPATVLRPGTEPALLSDWAHRAALLHEAGADVVGALSPTRALLGLEPEAFFELMSARYRLAGIVEGHDFHFGKARRGTPEVLCALAAARGIAARIVEPVEVDLNDQTIVRASSTIVRWLLERGRVADAALVLGRDYALVGEVVRGDRLGRTIGVPTANLKTMQVLPDDGVYAGWAVLPDGARHAAAIHVGPRATLDDHARTCEAHILDWDGPACSAEDPEYGWTIELGFSAWLRGQARFESLDALVTQMRLDIARAGEMARGATLRGVAVGE